MNYRLLAALSLSAFLFSACGQPTPPVNQDQGGVAKPEAAGPAGEERVETDATAPAASGTDADGFVRLPGEPSRGDSAYYVTEDLCAQFTKDYIGGLLGKFVAKAETSLPGRSTDCRYELNDDATVFLNLQYLDIAGQVKGHEVLGRTATAVPSIPMDNYVVKQENGLINEIYLVLGPNKFISINRSSGKALSEDELLAFAGKLGAKVKDFK